VTNAVTCALTEYGDIDCMRADWTPVRIYDGPYLYMDAGLNVLCAIRKGGSLACWQHEDAPAEARTFVPVSPPIDPDW
jgi:hypothetical protein